MWRVIVNAYHFRVNMKGTCISVPPLALSDLGIRYLSGRQEGVSFHLP